MNLTLVIVAGISTSVAFATTSFANRQQGDANSEALVKAGEVQLHRRTGPGAGVFVSRVARAMGLSNGASEAEVLDFVKRNYELLERSNELTRFDKWKIRNYKNAQQKGRIHAEIRYHFTKPDWEAFKLEQKQLRATGQDDEQLRSLVQAYEKVKLIKAEKRAAKYQARRLRTNPYGPGSSRDFVELSTPRVSGSGLRESASNSERLETSANPFQPEQSAPEAAAPDQPRKTLKLFGVEIPL